MTARTLTTLAMLALPISLAAQAPQPAPPPKPTQTPPAPTIPSTQPPATRKPAPATRGPIEVRVTSRSGEPIAGVAVTLEGNMARSGQTDQEGVVLLRTVPAGQYRLRFAKPGFMALERDITVRQSGTTRVEVALSEAEAPPPAPLPPPVAAPNPAPAPAGNVEPKTIGIPDFIDQNYLGRAPRKDSVLGCTDSMTSTLIQLREPLGEHTHNDGDEVLYIVAGEATHKVGGREFKLEPGTYSLVPRGVPHSITRRGSNPVVLLSIETGQPCASGVTAR
ncbi:MAG TPA: carboxypeptidase regulatory-like domain-containing protein [Vicinamibacterales bacterium]|jgi:mannose-6-phosphate isomerase-like protein (cupin superfamily)|nr:carboxypeptidase regulatory-like domain-containing protein [Vicinamibacterales bacterium]